MNLHIETRRVDPDIAVVHLSGRITLGTECGVEPLVKELLHKNERKIIFDLTALEQIDSTGAQILINCFCALRESGGQLRLASSPGTKVARLIKVTRLASVLPLFDTVDAACQEFTLTQKASG